jgi:hypothetical protein
VPVEVFVKETVDPEQIVVAELVKDAVGGATDDADNWMSSK